MAKGKKAERELFERLRARGLRKKVARSVAGAANKKHDGRLPKPVRSAIGDLQAAIGEVEARVGGKRSAAAKKAAQTRKRKAAKRKAAAKKAARTRAKAGR
jgi:hypothetical protein